MAFWDRLKSGLTKTRDAIKQGTEDVLVQLDPTRPDWDRASLEPLEEALIAADVGMESVDELLERVRRARPRNRAELETTLIDEVARETAGAPETAPAFQSPDGVKPWVVLLVGVNGAGKTTLAGKLAARERARGRKVLLVAADTFRAAAGEQLEIWAERAGVELLRQKAGADPAAVAHDGMEMARSRAMDVVIVDTAGRLHTRTNLMDELAKVRRVIAKLVPGAPHETLLVLDATLGQNGVAQARQFNEALGVTGVALTKLDGTARGGVVLAVRKELGLPIRLIGVGETLEDVDDFEPKAFAEALVRG